MFVFSLALLIPGCSSGPTPIKVSGKVNYGGQPLKTTEGVTIVFHVLTEDGKPSDTHPANPLDTDGSFTVPGRDHKGIPAGKYKVSVQQMTSNKSAQIEADKINEMFSPEKTQIHVEVAAAGETSITLDLSKPTGK
jgi:hypothetical protein